MKIIKNGGITTPKGFTANGIACGIKKSGKLDLAIIYSQKPTTCAAVYTKNSIKAAPLLVTQEKLRNNIAQAILVNSGNANCFTGNFGLLYARQSTELIAHLLKINKNDVLVTSTGIIGKLLPYNKIKSGAPTLIKGLNKAGGHKAAKAILTTDLATKEIAVEVTLSGKKVFLGAMAKGSGMIAPDMATMLAFITTDAAISAGMLKKALKIAIDQSFNNITIDGCMSTNDMVTVMANGLAQNKAISREDADFKIFSQALSCLCLDLAKKIVWDAEGITKFIEITVGGAKDALQGKKAGFAIANSALVKTAAFGSNPNWGRVAAAVGSIGLNITEKQLKISFSSFANKHIRIFVNLNLGKHQVTVYTSDLSLEYVKINGRYN